MMMEHNTNYLIGLMKELCNLPLETEWAEFKLSLEDIGEYISALINFVASL
jgi:hypothetical protein